jgi:hypothetical protein
MAAIITFRPSDAYLERTIEYFAKNGFTQTSQKLVELRVQLKEIAHVRMGPKEVPATISPLLEALLVQLAQEVRTSKLVPDNVRDSGIWIVRSLLKRRGFFLLEAINQTVPQEPVARRIPGGWARGPYPNMTRRNTRAAQEVLDTFLPSELPKTLRFYGMCFGYLLFVESSIVPLGRRLHTAYLASKRGLSYLKCSGKRINKVRQIALGGLQNAFDQDESTRGLIDKAYVVLRNSIGHASFTYEEEDDLAHFVPLDKETWGEIAEKSITLSLNDFQRMIYDALSLGRFLDLITLLLPLTDILVVEIQRAKHPKSVRRT